MCMVYIKKILRRDCIYNIENTDLEMGPPGIWGIWGEWLFISRELGSTGNYFREAKEQARSFGNLKSPTKKQKK